jgi:hypothetical protein
MYKIFALKEVIKNAVYQCLNALVEELAKFLSIQGRTHDDYLQWLGTVRVPLPFASDDPFLCF